MSKIKHAWKIMKSRNFLPYWEVRKKYKRFDTYYDSEGKEGTVQLVFNGLLLVQYKNYLYRIDKEKKPFKKCIGIKIGD